MTKLNNRFYATGARFRMFRLPHAMEPVLRQYEIPPPQIKVSWWTRIALFLGIGCFTFIFRWIVEAIFHWGRQPVPESLFMPVALGAVLGLRFPKWLSRGGRLIIGEDFVEGHTRARWFTYKKRIRRDRIKSISESKRGLCVMDRGEFAARMLGFVFVPATIPEYQEIKALLMRWVPVQSPS
jgi:hypothetical protein